MKNFIFVITILFFAAIFAGCTGKTLPGYMEGKEKISAISKEGDKIYLIGEIYDYEFDANLTIHEAKILELAKNKSALSYLTAFITIDKYDKNSDKAYFEHEIILKKSELPLSLQARLLDDPEQKASANEAKFRFYYINNGRYFKRLPNHDEILRDHALAAPKQYPVKIIYDSGEKSERDKKTQTDIDNLILLPLMLPALIIHNLITGGQ